jgi:hypothetical protein
MAQKKAAARRTSHRKQASSSRAPVAKKQQNARAAASWTDRVENTAGKVAETAKETFEKRQVRAQISLIKSNSSRRKPTFQRGLSISGHPYETCNAVSAIGLE